MKPKFLKYVNELDQDGNNVLTSVECQPNEATHIHICFHDEAKMRPCKVIEKGNYHG